MTYEEPEIVNSRAEEDPIIIEAIFNIQMAIQHIARIWEATGNMDLADAQADLEQAVRWLRGEEKPE
jgi:hypothetical protein